MKFSLNITLILLLAKILVIAQTPCEQKLKNAKNSIVAIINSGGSSTKINQTATDVMTNMALNCPEMVKEFNKFIQNLDTKGLDGNVQGNYQTNQQRQKNTDEFFNKQNSILIGQGTNNNNNNSSQENININRIGTDSKRMQGDGYAELPFDDTSGNENLKSTANNLSDLNQKMDNLANMLETLQANGNEKFTIVDNFNALQRKLNANQISLSEAAIEYNAIKQRVNDIKAGKNQGYRPDTYISNSTINLETEIKNFEYKLASVPENLKPDLLAKANHIIKTETNKQEAALKLNNLMNEFEKNKTVSTQNVRYSKRKDGKTDVYDDLTKSWEVRLQSLGVIIYYVTRELESGFYRVHLKNEDIIKVTNYLRSNGVKNYNEDYGLLYFK